MTRASVLGKIASIAAALSMSSFRTASGETVQPFKDQLRAHHAAWHINATERRPRGKSRGVPGGVRVDMGQKGKGQARDRGNRWLRRSIAKAGAR